MQRVADTSIKKVGHGLDKYSFVNGKSALTFDDVWMVPQHSSLSTRDDADLKSEIFKGVLTRNPLVATCMDTVCEDSMLKTMVRCGGTGMIHRGCSPKRQAEMLSSAIEEWKTGSCLENPPIFGYAVNCDSWEERMANFFSIDRSCCLKYFVCLDAAHAHTDYYRDKLKGLFEHVKERDSTISILAGTIASPQAVEFLAPYCDGIRVGVGSGSACITRIQTGHGVPLFQSLIECSHICKAHGVKCFADGGIRTPGDAVKALGAGADALVLGGILAATSDSPAPKIRKFVRRGFSVKKKIVAVRYRGMASKEAQQSFSHKRRSGYYVEGEAFDMPYSGDTTEFVENFLRSMRSGLTYSGAKNIEELKDKARFRMATFAGLQEAKPHGKK